MKIESNLAGVIERMQRLHRAVPAALARTLAPDGLAPNGWAPAARKLAEDTLLTLAQPRERIFIQQFVRTVEAAVLGGGFVLRMRPPFAPAQTLESLQAARAGFPAGGNNLFQQPVREFEDLLTDWVANVKDKTKVDAGKTDAEIAEFISYALISPGGADLTVKSGPNQGARVRDVFTPHIAKYLADRQAERRLPEATVDAWLRAVLAAWQQLVTVRGPQEFLRRLEHLRTTPLKQGKLL